LVSIVSLITDNELDVQGEV